MKIKLVFLSLFASVLLLASCAAPPVSDAPSPPPATVSPGFPPKEDKDVETTAPPPASQNAPIIPVPPPASPPPAAPPPEPTAPAPTLSNVAPSRTIGGANNWLFAIDDGEPLLAVSAESAGSLLVGRLDVADPNSAVAWKKAADTADTGGGTIADHWHIFAHGYHWLVFSVSGDSASYLLKLDKDFRRIAIVPVGHTDGPTNDMFLVAEPSGVAVGHFAPGYGHTIHRFDKDAVKTGQVRIGGGQYSHSNGSSAISVKDGFVVFATESLNPSATGAVRSLSFDSSWNIKGRQDVLNEDGINAAMASAVRLDSGYTIVHLRVRTGVSPRPQGPVPPPQMGLLPDDSGAIVRLILDPKGSMVSRETLAESGGNRVHTAVSGDLLITTWDGGGQLKLRVDRLQ